MTQRNGVHVTQQGVWPTRGYSDDARHFFSGSLILRFFFSPSDIWLSPKRVHVPKAFCNPANNGLTVPRRIGAIFHRAFSYVLRFLSIDVLLFAFIISSFQNIYKMKSTAQRPRFQAPKFKLSCIDVRKYSLERGRKHPLNTYVFNIKFQFRYLKTVSSVMSERMHAYFWLPPLTIRMNRTLASQANSYIFLYVQLLHKRNIIYFTSHS